MIGVLNASMVGMTTEPGEHVNWSEPDYFEDEGTFFYCLALFPEELAEISPHLIIFEIED